MGEPVAVGLAAVGRQGADEGTLIDHVEGLAGEIVLEEVAQQHAVGHGRLLHRQFDEPRLGLHRGLQRETAVQQRVGPLLLVVVLHLGQRAPRLTVVAGRGHIFAIGRKGYIR